MIQSDKGTDPPKKDMKVTTATNSKNGLSQILRLLLQELDLFYSRDVNGVCLLYNLLHSPWLQALLKVYDCLQEFKEKRPVPDTAHAQALSAEVMELLGETPNSPEIHELRQILQASHFKALLSAHDTVAQKDFEPLLPPLPDTIPESEEAMRIVCLVKNQQPLGATIKRHEMTGDILVARIIHGGLAERSGLLYAGDKLVEVNGVSVEGLDPEQVIHILGGPGHWRPEEEVMSVQSTLGGRGKQREFWWSQPYQPHSCLKSTIYKEEFVDYGQKFFIAGFRRSMRLCRRKSHLSHLRTSVCCSSSCYNAVGASYEEVVQYQRHPSDKHRLIVLVGPSGVGVNELRRQLIELNPIHFQSAVPHTTRSKKSYEMNGREYHYVSKETFENLMYSHRMLEYGEYKGHLYGTSVDAVQAVLDQGKVCVMDLEPQGIQVARTQELKPYVIFIKPSNLSCMKLSRKNAKIITDYFVEMKFKDEDLQEMEDLAQKMEAQFGQYFDHVIVNDNLQDACVQLLSVVRKAQEEPQWVPATWIFSDTTS
nr:LOW QUALITY PROTEIN: MAGUK p55 subfamily member 4 [Loxodonta africana]